MIKRVVAVDLGASSGRVYAADVGTEHFALIETARFDNGPVQIGERLYWDILGLYRGILEGLTQANRDAPVVSIGVDSWAVDYGLIRADGSLLSNPACYRDPRTGPAIGVVGQRLGLDELFRRTGIAHQPFNTAFQLMTDEAVGYLGEVHHALLIPDLINYFLTGVAATEFTNASTTQLVDTRGQWDNDFLQWFNLPKSLFARIVQPGNVVGPLSADIAKRLGLGTGIQVINVASHDTASAVVAVPATSPNFAYISCGTWSLVGMELESPILSERARAEGFSNERGVEGTYRFLHNVMGLWLLQESIRVWETRGISIDVADLVRRCGSEAPLKSVFDINDASFLTPGDMPARISELCRESGEPVPQSPEEFARCILDSLAMAYRQAVTNLQSITGQTVDVVYIVGGGVNNKVLCQLTADACGVDVIAGPIEAAAIGNVLVQANSIGIVPGDRWALRSYLARNHDFDVYHANASMTRRFGERAR